MHLAVPKTVKSVLELSDCSFKATIAQVKKTRNYDQYVLSSSQFLYFYLAPKVLKLFPQIFALAQVT